MLSSEAPHKRHKRVSKRTEKSTSSCPCGRPAARSTGGRGAPSPCVCACEFSSGRSLSLSHQSISRRQWHVRRHPHPRGRQAHGAHPQRHAQASLRPEEGAAPRRRGGGQGQALLLPKGHHQLRQQALPHLLRDHGQVRQHRQGLRQAHQPRRPHPAPGGGRGRQVRRRVVRRRRAPLASRLCPPHRRRRRLARQLHDHFPVGQPNLRRRGPRGAMRPRA
jgi:hypothetical protein